MPVRLVVHANVNSVRLAEMGLDIAQACEGTVTYTRSTPQAGQAAGENFFSSSFVGQRSESPSPPPLLHCAKPNAYYTLKLAKTKQNKYMYTGRLETQESH